MTREEIEELGHRRLGELWIGRHEQPAYRFMHEGFVDGYTQAASHYEAKPNELATIDNVYNANVKLRDKIAALENRVERLRGFLKDLAQWCYQNKFTYEEDKIDEALKQDEDKSE